MSYLDDIGKKIEQHVPNDMLPDADTEDLFRLYALLALAKGAAVTLSDVHNAWAAWMQQRNPGHRSIRPFEELDAETQASDRPFLIAIQAVAEHLNLV